MPATSSWFTECGFQVFQVPGVSRAWRYEFLGGLYVLVTDVGGYDLPEIGGPYAAMSLSCRDELLEIQTWLRGTRELHRWLRHIQRRSQFESRQFHAASFSTNSPLNSE